MKPQVVVVNKCDLPEVQAGATQGGFRAWGLGFRVYGGLGVGFRVRGLGFRV